MKTAKAFFSIILFGLTMQIAHGQEGVPDKAPTPTQGTLGGFICQHDGETVSQWGGCNPVNLWWCEPETSCLGTAEFAVAEVLAPSRLSGLNPPIPQPWYEHYNACRAGYFLEKARADNCEAKQAPAPQPTCQAFPDGPNGRLWKPISDNDGRLVVLMPASYREARPELKNVAGELVARLTAVSCCANGNRVHYRFDRPGAALPSPTFMHIAGECFQVSNPSARID